MFLEIHTLTDRGLCCLNRDRENRMKTGVWGGVERARQSSQNIKHSIREYLRDNKLIQKVIATRTRELPTLLLNDLVKAGKNEEDSKKVIEATIAALGLKFDKKRKSPEEGEDQTVEVKEEERKFWHTGVILYYDQTEYAGLLGAITKHFDDLGSKNVSATAKKAVLEQFAERTSKSAEIALLGRFIANIDSMHVEGAAEVAHAMSCNKLSVMKDFYIAMDDVTKSGGNLGDQEIGSNLMYQYATVNLTTLSKNLQNDSQIGPVAAAFAEAFMLATPKAKRTSTAEHSRPTFVRVVVRDVPVSAHQAFEVPIRPENDESATQLAVKALLKHSLAQQKAYGKGDIKLDVCFMASEWQPDTNLTEEIGTENVGSLKNVIDRVQRTLPK